MIKKILTLFLICCLLFNLVGCSAGNGPDIDKLALQYINAGIQYGDGFLSQLDTKNTQYKNVFDQLKNAGFSEEKLNNYKTIWDQNYTQYKAWFNNSSSRTEITDNGFKTNITWVLSPSTLACLYNYYQILNIVNKYRDLVDTPDKIIHKAFIIPTSFKPERTNAMCTPYNDPKDSSIFGKYIGNDSLTSVSKMDNLYEVLKKVTEMNAQLKDKDSQQNPWFSKASVTGDDIIGYPFNDESGLNANSNNGFTADKVTQFKGSSKIDRCTLSRNTPITREDMLTKLSFFSDQKLTEEKQFEKLVQAFNKAGFCGVVYIEENYEEWTDIGSEDEEEIYYAELTRQLQWDLAPFIIFDGSALFGTSGNFDGKSYQLETFPNLLKNQNQIIDFVFNDSSEIQKKINVNNTVKGITTCQERISNTGNSDDELNISSKVFQYQDDTLEDIINSFNDYRAKENSNKNEAKKIAYDILTQFVDGENIETDEIFRSTKAGSFTNNLSFENIFDIMINNKIDKSWNEYQNDWIFTINSVPFMAIRAYQIRQDAAEHMSDKLSDELADNPFKREMKYQSRNDAKIQGKAVIDSQVKIDVIDKISNSGFTTTNNGLYLDLWENVSTQTKTGFIRPEDNDKANGVITQNYELNHSYWKAPNGHMLLAKYYATYDIGQIDNTEGNQSWSGPTPIGRAMYLNTNNVNYDRENNIYTWKKPDQPVFYMADPSTNEYPSILNGMQIYLSDLGTGSLEGLDNSLEQELAVPDYSLLTRGGN